MPDAASPYVGQAREDRYLQGRSEERDAREERVKALMRVDRRAAQRDHGPEVDRVY